MLDYDVSLHNLVVLVVTIPTSPRLSKTEFIRKSYGALDLLLDLPRRWSGVSGPAGISGPDDRSLRRAFLSAKVWCVSGTCPEVGRRQAGISGPGRSLRPKDPESPVLRFSLPSAFLVVHSCCQSGVTPEMVRSLRPDRSLRSEDSESPVSSLFPAFCPSVVRLWCQTGGRPEAGRNLRSRPESPV